MHQTQWSPERPLPPPVSLASQSHHEKPPEVTCTSRGNPGFPASTRERLGTKPFFRNGILYFAGKTGDISYELPQPLTDWVCKLLEESSPNAKKDFSDGKKIYHSLKYWLDLLPNNFFEDKENLFDNELWEDLREAGLILL